MQSHASTADHALSQWSEKYRQSQSPYKDPDAAIRLATLMLSAGLVDVEARDMPLPMSAWSNSQCTHTKTKGISEISRKHVKTTDEKSGAH